MMGNKREFRWEMVVKDQMLFPLSASLSRAVLRSPAALHTHLHQDLKQLDTAAQETGESLVSHPHILHRQHLLHG